VFRYRQFKLGIAAVYKKELQVFCVETELMQLPANSVCECAIRRGPGPAVLPACMFEFQITAIRKEQSAPVELRIDDIPNNTSLRQFSKHGTPSIDQRVAVSHKPGDGAEIDARTPHPIAAVDHTE
jgi:hypothetical protein